MPLFIITILVAACSMIYELMLAQSMTILYGHATSRYSMTIGLFLFSLGMGTLLYSPLQKRYNKNSLFIYLEVLLCLAGVSTPVIIFNAAASTTLQAVGLDGYIICHLWVLVIGTLTGIEVPCLLDKGNGLTQTNESTFLILALDFLGTFFGVLLFVFFLYPIVGLVGAAALTGGFNGLAAIILWYDSKERPRPALFALGISAGIALALFLSRSQVTTALIERAF